MDSRIEEILKEKVGDPYEEVPLMSRIEILLDRLGSGSGGSGDSSEYAHSLELTINSQTYVMTATLKNTSGEILGTPQTIDLPLETMVVGGSYDDTTKKVILTLKNGNTVDFSVADLVSGLQTEITSTNKLNSDLVDDTNQNNKFVTSAEKTKIANALTEEVYNAGKQVKTDNKTGEIFNDYTTNKATGNYSHAEGGGTNAIGNHSHAEGSYTTASGNYSHAEGADTIVRGHFSHAEGCNTIASSKNQHVQGKYNVGDSSEKYAFIIGNGTSTTTRSNAFAIDWEGKIYVNNSATGVDVSQLLTEEVYNAGKTTPYGTQYVIAGETYTVGRNAEIFNDYNNNKAIGEYSHAEGYGTTARDNYSHAEGGYTTANGSYSHAEGGFTYANGSYSHAEGYTSTANGSYSHAEGLSTRASSNYQHAQGKFNIEDSNSKYAFIIGNGTDTNNRSNAFAVDWNGLIYVNNAATGVDVSDLLARIIVLENKVAALENA